MADALDVGTGFVYKSGADVLGWHGNDLVLGQTEDAIRFVPKIDAQHVSGFGRRIGDEASARKHWAEILGGAPDAVWVMSGAATASP